MNNMKEVHNNYDAVFKEALMLYKNKTLDFLGLDLAMIDEPLNTEMTEVKVNKNFADMCFMLKDKTGLHTEWEAAISVDDMLRFCSYNLHYTRMYKTDFVTVIFTNKIQRVNHFENNMIKFTPIIIDLGKRDGDALLQKIKNQIECGEPINELELIYLPLYRSNYKNAAELLEQVVTIAPMISKPKEEIEKIMILSVLLANKFIDEKDFKNIWEVVKMYIDDLLVIKYAKEDARKEGKKEGKKEAKTEFVVKMLNGGLDIESIAKYADLPQDEIYKIKEKLICN